LSVFRDTPDGIIQITRGRGRENQKEKAIITAQQTNRRCTMKGYYTEIGYMGYVNNQYVLFSSEADYLDFMED